MKPDRIATDRMVLRPFRLPDDLSAAHEALDLDQEDGAPMTLLERERLLRWRVLQFEVDEVGCYAVERTDDNALLGYCGLQFWLAPTGPEVELFYKLGRRYWGSGYATEASSAVLRMAWETLGLARTVSNTFADNERSIRLLRRLGADVRPHPHDPRFVIGTIERPSATP